MDERTRPRGDAARGVRDGASRGRRAGATTTAPGPTGSRSTPRRRGAARRVRRPRAPGTRCSGSRRASRRWRALQAPSCGRRAGRSWRSRCSPSSSASLADALGRLRAASTCWRRRCGACWPGTLVVYLGLLVVRRWCALARRGATRRGPIVRGVAERCSRRRIRLPRLAAGGSAAGAAPLRARSGWRAAAASRRGAPRPLLHAAAAALALGLIAGLYLRGLVLDYRAGWESTFLDARGRARRSSRRVLGAGGALSGIALPDVAAFAALRAVHGDAGRRRAGGAVDPPARADAAAGRRAAARAARARWRASRARWRARALPAAARRSRTSSAWRACSAAARRSVVVFPYGSTPSPQATLGLRALLADAFGPRVALDVAPRVAFGAEDDAPLAVPTPDTTHAIALFDLARDAREPRTRRASCARLAAALPAGAALAVLRRRIGSSRAASPALDEPRRRSGARRGGCWGEGAWQRAARLDASTCGVEAERAPRSPRRHARRRALALAAGGRDRRRRTLGATISLSLVSHTNAGKTTLARTLLGRDVGEVRDAPHVTEFADVHTMLETRRGRAAAALGHAGLRRQRAARAKRLRAVGAPDRLVPERGLGPLARPAVLGQPAGAAQRARRGRRDALPRQRRRVAGGGRLRRARDGAAGLDRQAGDRAAQPARRAARAGARGGRAGALARAPGVASAPCARCCRSTRSRAAGCRS